MLGAKKICCRSYLAAIRWPCSPQDSLPPPNSGERGHHKVLTGDLRDALLYGPEDPVKPWWYVDELHLGGPCVERTDLLAFWARSISDTSQ